MFNKEFWKDSFDRAIFTMAETLLGIMSGYSLFSELNWKAAISSVLFSALYTLLKCIVVTGVGKKDE